MGQTWAVPARAVLAALVLALTALVGCGGDDEAGAPASLAPAGSLAYAEATVRPEGEQQRDAEAAARKALGTDDPAEAIAEIADELIGERLDLRKDVEPWLGKRVAVAVLKPSGRDPQGLVLAETTDEKAALEAVRGDRTVKTERVGDVEYGVTRPDRASVVVDDVLLAGSEAAVRAALTARDDPAKALESQERFRKARADVGGDDALGFAYVDLRSIVRAAGAEADDARGVAAATALSGLGLESLGIAFRADGERLAARGALRSKEGLPRGGGGGADALAQAPADSVVAVGLGDVGGTVDALIDRFGGLVGVALSTAFEEIRRETGLDVRRDVLGWMGDATFFVRGTGAADVGGALVVQSTAPDRSRKALPLIARLLRGQGIDLRPASVPGTDLAFRLRGGPAVVLAQAGDRVVLAFDPPSLRAALATDGRLAENPRFRRAASLMSDGIRPTLFADPAAIGTLVGAFGGPKGDKTQRVLERFGALVAGTRAEGPLDRFELLVPLEG